MNRLLSASMTSIELSLRLTRIAFSAGLFLVIDFCFSFVPFGHYDEPEVLLYENSSMCPMGADVRHVSQTAMFATIHVNDSVAAVNSHIFLLRALGRGVTRLAGSPYEPHEWAR